MKLSKGTIKVSFVLWFAGKPGAENYNRQKTFTNEKIFQ